MNFINKANWKELILDELKKYGENFSDIESITLSEEELNRYFDAGSGCHEGEAFTAWTKNRVYFPAVYDGQEWCASVSRNPDSKPTWHVGGE